MFIHRKSSWVVVAVLLAAAWSVQAAIVSNITFTSAGGEVALKTILESATGATYDKIADQSPLNEVFTSSGPISFTLLAQQAGHAPWHILSYYTAGVNPIRTLSSTSAVPDGVTSLIGDVDLNGSVEVTTKTVSIGHTFGLFFDDDYYGNRGGPHRFENGFVAGLYPSERQFDPDGNDFHFAVYYDKTSAGEIIANSYLVAVEDVHTNADNDYNDFVFRMSGAEVVPEPATALLLALGGGLTWLLRLRQRY
jgi:hypothetical protein